MDARVIDGVRRDVRRSCRSAAERGDGRRRRTDGERELVVDAQSVLVGRERRQASIIEVRHARRARVDHHPAAETVRIACCTKAPRLTASFPGQPG